MKSDLASLKLKLIASIALIAGVAIIATIVTSLTLTRVGQSVSRLASDTLSLAAANARFAEIGQAVRVDVPLLGNAETQFDREAAAERLRQHFQTLRALLPRTRATAGFAASVEDVLGRLDATVQDLDRSVARRFGQRAVLSAQIARINRLHGDFLLEVDPLLTDAKFNVAAALRDVDGSAGRPWQERRDGVAVEIRNAEALGRLHANANLAVGLMLRGAAETDFRRIEHLKGRLADTIAEANVNAAGLSVNPSAITLRQLWEEIADYGQPGRDLLALKLRENALSAESLRLQEENGVLLERLGSIVAGAVRESGLRSETVAAEIDGTVARGRVFSVVSMLVMLGLLLAFTVFYVRGQLFGRLMAVLTSMQAISDGDKDVRVPVEGKDEIGQLADAVRLFRHKSQALDQRARELNQSNIALTGEIARRRGVENDLRETQAELVQAAKLAALGQLSAGIAHEFNQPLMAMGSYTHNAVRYLEKGETAMCREKLGDIDRLIKRLSKSSNHLKTFARRPQEAATRHDVREVMANALSLFEQRIASETVEVVWRQPGEPVDVMTEPAQLEQVFVNLISNALDAMKNSDTPRLTIGIEETGRLARVSLSDTGAGLSEEARDRAFDPFFTTKPPGEGLGLGLSISYNIVRDLGGRLDIGRAEEGGVIATVELFKT
ncbi:ATP-binding protein [Stappia sp.]|uniref:ATP-binding protein n=1 Tax=Stappia sp. TaxID=1870903 RepID=UPI003D133098